MIVLLLSEKIIKQKSSVRSFARQKTILKDFRSIQSEIDEKKKKYLRM